MVEPSFDEGLDDDNTAGDAVVDIDDDNTGGDAAVDISKRKVYKAYAYFMKLVRKKSHFQKSVNGKIFTFELLS